MTREQAIEDLKKVFKKNTEHFESINMAINALSRQEQRLTPATESRPEQRWIPVTESLPKSIANKVLVFLDHDDFIGYIGFGHYEKYHGTEIWYDLEHNEPFSDRGYTVTHWMPLPDDPEFSEERHGEAECRS